MSDLPKEFEKLEVKDIFALASPAANEYDAQSAMVVLMYVMQGKSIVRAIEAFNDANPGHNLTRQRFYRWRVFNPELEKLYQLALRERTHAIVEDILDIADDATDDATMGAQGPIINGKAIRRAELMIKTRQWMAGKFNPEAYGDKSQMELTGKDGKDLVPTTFNIGLVPAGHFVPRSDEDQKEQGDGKQEEPTAD